MRISTTISKTILVSGIGLLLSVCAPTPDPSAPGNCTLSCGNKTKIAAADMRIRFLDLPGDAMSLSCQGVADGEDYPGSIAVQFVIESTKAADLPASQIPAADGSEKTPDPLVKDVGMPAAGISFEPIVVSGWTGPYNPDSTRLRYRGIVTSQDQWCTDSCGVGSVELIPTCKSSSNVISLNIHSGAATSNATITVSPQ